MSDEKVIGYVVGLPERPEDPEIDLVLYKDFATNFMGTSCGDGLWGLEGGTPILVSRIELSINKSWDGKSFYGEARCYHNAPASDFGLLYTDGIEKDIEQYMLDHPVIGEFVKSACGSEQGMQGENYLSMDISLTDGVDSFAMLRANGFYE